MELSQRKFEADHGKIEHNVALGNGYLPQKELNARLAALQLLAQDYSLETMPQWVGFTTTTFCNLRCVHCDTHGTEERRKEFNKRRWPPEMLRRLAEECLPSASEFNLTNTGEPLATPGLKEHLAELRQYGAKLVLTTNGTLLSKDNLVDLIPLLGQVGFSVDGASRFTVEKLRVGVKFEQQLTKIRLLTRTYELLPEIPRPPIRLFFVLMGSNLREMPRMVQLAHALKVPAVTFSFLIVCHRHLEAEAVDRHKALYNSYSRRALLEAERLNVRIDGLRPPFPSVAADADAPVGGPGMIIREWPPEYFQTLPSFDSLLDHDAIEAEAAEVADAVRRRSAEFQPAAGSIDLYRLRRMQDALKNALRRNRRETERLATGVDEKVGYCPHLHHRTFINARGYVAPCCLPGRPTLGNVNDNTVREIWNGTAYHDFRRRFQTPEPPNCCRKCHFRTHRSKQELLKAIAPEVSRL